LQQLSASSAADAADAAYDDELACPPCVSVGLSLGPFRLAGKQPGWDAFSLGYHGDDGCFFHGARASSFD